MGRGRPWLLVAIVILTAAMIGGCTGNKVVYRFEETLPGTPWRDPGFKTGMCWLVYGDGHRALAPCSVRP